MRYLAIALVCLAASLSFAQQNTYCGGFLAGNEVDGGGYSGQMQFNQIQQWSGWPPATMAPLLIAVREARVGVPAGSSPFKGSHH